MPSDFQDHFSAHAVEYAAARPTYPAALFDWLADIAPDRKTAWDCATGAGQAAVELASRFDCVFATDASAAMIAAAKPHPRISYATALAERSGLDDHSVSLVTVAQALHWLNFEVFFREVRRVLRPGGAIVVWGYELATASPEIDQIIRDFYAGPIREYWPAERKHVESSYREVPFPFPRITVPQFEMREDWTADQMLAYLRTWSSVRRYLAATGNDPVIAIEGPLRTAWGDHWQSVVWPLVCLAGRVSA